MGSVKDTLPATMKSLIILAFLGVVAVESFTDEDHHHEKDSHDDGHAFGFKAVFQPRAHRFVRSADADAGYGGYGGYGGLGGFGGFGGGLYGHGLYGHGYGHGYKYGHSYGGFGGHGYKYGHSYGGYGGYGKRSADSGEDNIIDPAESDRRIAEADPEADAKAGFGLGGYGLGGLGGFGFGGLGGYGLGGLGLGYGYGGLYGGYGGGLYGRGLYGGYGLW